MKLQIRILKKAAQHALAPDAASLRCAAQVKRKPLGVFFSIAQRVSGCAVKS
jgi:hypothetical protein